MFTYVDKNQQLDTSRNIIISNHISQTWSCSKFRRVPHVFLGRIGLLHLEAPLGQLLRHGQLVALGVLQEDQREVVLLTVDANEGTVTFPKEIRKDWKINWRLKMIEITNQQMSTAVFLG